MAKIIFTLLALLTSAAISAAPVFRIFRVIGNVEYSDGTGYANAEPKIEVKLTTKFKIPAGASVKLLDTEKNTIYTSSGSGEQTVAQIIKEAKKQADSSVKLIAQTTLKNISSTRHGSGAKGEALREDEAEIGEVESAIAKALLSGRNDTDTPITYRKSYVSDSTYVFEVTSVYDAPVYVNIARIKDGKATLLFDVNYTAGAPFLAIEKGTTRLSPFVFYGGQEDTLVSVASNVLFEVPLIKAMLDGTIDPTLTEPKSEELKVWISK